jgi:hypothetical protein
MPGGRIVVSGEAKSVDPCISTRILSPWGELWGVGVNYVELIIDTLNGSPLRFISHMTLLLHHFSREMA